MVVQNEKKNRTTEAPKNSKNGLLLGQHAQHQRDMEVLLNPFTTTSLHQERGNKTQWAIHKFTMLSYTHGCGEV